MIHSSRSLNSLPYQQHTFSLHSFIMLSGQEQLWLLSHQINGHVYVFRKSTIKKVLSHLSSHQYHTDDCGFFSPVQFSCSVVSDSLWPHGLQHTRPPCPSLTPGAYSNSCSSSQWCHPTISFSVICFSSSLQSFPASGSFPMSRLFTSGSQSTGVSASASILPMNIQDWSPLGWTGWISLQSKGLSRVFSNTTVKSINSLALTFLCSPTLTSIHDYWKNYSFD